MAFTREELDWIEGEWAFHLHGRCAFLSREDFACLQEWGGKGTPAQVIVSAMEAFFQRRAQRARQKSYVALSHLEKDLEKAMKYRASLQRSGQETLNLPEWEAVREPLRSNPAAKAAFEAWKRLNLALPSPDHPAYLDRFDEERQAFQAFIALAESALRPQTLAIEQDLRTRMIEAGMEEGSLVWKRAWDHHWARLICEAWSVAARY